MYCLSLHFNYFVYVLFHDPSTNEIYNLSLHDALPILNKKEEADNIFRLCSENEDNITQNFVLPGHKKFLKILYKEVGKENLDRKSTRLNSSHLVISYAVFCLKKKNRRK